MNWQQYDISIPNFKSQIRDYCSKGGVVMAQAEYEKSSYGAFERFIYLFLIPIVFTAILTFVLLSVFDYNVLNTMLKVADKIPVVQNIVPEPKIESDAELGSADAPALSVEELEIKLAQAEADLTKQIDSNGQIELQITELQAEIAALNEQLDTKRQTEEEYLARIQELAGVYSKMNPSKAAPILENLTLHERVLILNEMKQADQINVLEKMEPEMAAEASILLKDQVLVTDTQIAALQERLALHSDESTPILTNAELAQTFANMTPNSAATLLLEMINVNENQVIEILRAMNVQARSTLLDEITDRSQTQAASISAKLGE